MRSSKLRMSSKRTPNSTVRIGYDPAVVNDSTKLFTTRLGTQRFTQRFSAKEELKCASFRSSVYYLMF